MGAATVKGSFETNGTTYEYAEFKTSNRGGGSRGIRIWVSGKQDEIIYRKLDPNPHSVRRYNNSRQETFYHELAESIAAHHARGGGWPPNRTAFEVACLREEFTVYEW